MTPAVVELDLGGVLLADGTKNAFANIETATGLPHCQIDRLWHAECRIPTDLGAMPSQQVFNRPARHTGMDPAQIEDILLGEVQPIPAGAALLQIPCAQRIPFVPAINHLIEWIDRRQQAQPGGR